jgi:Fe-S oxidoreductase
METMRMQINVEQEIAKMRAMPVTQLHDRYAEVCGEQVRSRNRAYLIRRIAWKMQARAEGGLTDRALRRAEELADESEVRLTAPKTAGPPTALTTVVVPVASDTRIPPVGTAITRRYRDATISVTVLADGFEWNGTRYKSLSAVAKAITGSHINGYRFFGLENRE